MGPLNCLSAGLGFSIEVASSLPCLQIRVKQEVKQCYFHSSVIACKPLLISDYHLSEFR